MLRVLSDIEKAFNRGFNSYRIDDLGPISPYMVEALTIEFDAGWFKAKRYHDAQATSLRTSNFR